MRGWEGPMCVCMCRYMCEVMSGKEGRAKHSSSRVVSGAWCLVPWDENTRKARAVTFVSCGAATQGPLCICSSTRSGRVTSGCERKGGEAQGVVKPSEVK